MEVADEPYVPQVSVEDVAGGADDNESNNESIIEENETESTEDEANEIQRDDNSKEADDNKSGEDNEDEEDDSKGEGDSKEQASADEQTDEQGKFVK